MSVDEHFQVDGQIRRNRIAVYERLGKGGQSSVFRGKVVKGPCEGRAVAVKFVGAAGSAEREAEVLREMRILAELNTQGVPDFVDFGTMQGGEIWLAMELIEGADLGHYVRRNGPMQGEQGEASLLAILHQLTRILKRLSELDVRHRDLKPGNVIVNEVEGRLWLVDFGLAKAKSDLHATKFGSIKGTPAFLAPEAIMGRYSTASDLYGAAAVVYYCATGRPPHHVGDEPDYWAVARAVLESQPKPVAKVCPGVFSKRFSAMLSKAMHPDPEKRPTPDALMSEIESILSSSHCG
jgi:serine/threonine protein kinase